MPVNLPQPLFVPGGGGYRQRSLEEQALLTFLGQAPGLGFRLYETLQANQADKAQQDAALLALLSEAQAGNPNALNAFASEGLGLSPMAGPDVPTLGLEGVPGPAVSTEELPGVAPTKDMLDKLSSEDRRVLAAFFEGLPQLQTLRTGRDTEARAKREEVRTQKRFKKEMELKELQVIGEGYRNKIAKWDSSDDVLNARQRLLDLEVEDREFRVDVLNPREKRQRELAAEASRVQIASYGLQAGQDHWNDMMGDIQDLIRTYTAGIEDPREHRAAVISITNGLMQDRTPEDFAEAYAEYFSGSATAERRIELMNKLAGDTFITAATRYGLSSEEARAFREELDRSDPKTVGEEFSVYAKRIQQIRREGEIALLRNPDEGEEGHRDPAEIEAITRNHETEYRFIVNLYRRLHGQAPIGLESAARRREAGATLQENFKQFFDFGASADLLNNTFTVDPVMQAGRTLTQLGIVPRGFHPELEETMFGPPTPTRPSERARQIFTGRR